MRLKHIVASMILLSMLLTGCGKGVNEQSLKVKYFNSDPTNSNENRSVESVLNEAIGEMSSNGKEIELKNGGEGSNDILKSMNEALVKKGDSDVIIVTDLPLKNVIDKKMVLNLKESVSNYDEIYDGVKNEYALGIGQTRWIYYVKKELDINTLDEEGWMKVISAKDKGKFLVRDINDLSPIIDKNIQYKELYQGHVESDELYNKINVFTKNIENRVLSPKLESFEERIKFYCNLDKVREWNDKCIINSTDQILAYPVPCFNFFEEQSLLEQNKAISDQYEMVFSEKSDTIYALIPKNAKNKKMAIEFVNKLASKEYQSKIYKKSWFEYVVHETNRKVTEERVFASSLGKHIQSGYIEASNQNSQLNELDLTTYMYGTIYSINASVFSLAMNPMELQKGKNEILPGLKKFISDIKTSNGE